MLKTHYHRSSLIVKFKKKKKDGGHDTFGDNAKEKIIGIIGNHPSSYIENVLLVDHLKHNLISLSQLCKMSYRGYYIKRGDVYKKPK